MVTSLTWIKNWSSMPGVLNRDPIFSHFVRLYSTEKLHTRSESIDGCGRDLIYFKYHLRLNVEGTDVLLQRVQMSTSLGQLVSLNFFKVSGLITKKGITCGLVHSSTKKDDSFWF